MSVVIPTILSAGKKIDVEHELLTLDVTKELNRIPSARLTFLDGDSATGKFPISDSKTFALGSKIEIKLRYEGGKKKEASVFKGIVVRQGLDVRASASCIVVDMKDEAVKFTSPRRSEVFRKMSDDKVIGKILGSAKGEIAATKPVHAELVQYYATDWDFILSRAEALGLLVLVKDGKVSLAEMSDKGKGKLELEYGIDTVFDIEVEADAMHQRSGFESVGWDLKKQAPTKAAKGEDLKSKLGDLKSAAVAEKLGFTDPWTLSHPVPLLPEELKAWSDGRAARSQMAMIRGRVSAEGVGAVEPMDALKLKGLGKRFNGETIVTGVRHRVTTEGWRTDVQFGLSLDWFARLPDVREAPAVGLLPAVNGLQIGVVEKFEKDPDKELRVKVLLPGVDKDPKTGAVWARLAAPDAGAERGFFFRPEKGDEVVLGFFNDDPRHAVILGGLYGSKNKPPAAVAKLDAKNENKAIVTKAGTSIAFVDGDKPSVTIETPGGRKLVLDDKDEKIELLDKDGNTITMDAKGITLKSSKDFIVDAKGKVKIKGKEVTTL